MDEQMQSTSHPKKTDRSDSGNLINLFDAPLHIEKVGKASFVIVAGFFALGLIVTNTYLLQYGLSEFGLLRARFVLTGMLASFPAVLNLACLAFAYIVTKEITGQFGAHGSKRYVVTVAIIIWLVVGVLLPIVILGIALEAADFTDSDILDALLLWTIGFLPLLPFTLIALDRWT